MVEIAGPVVAGDERVLSGFGGRGKARSRVVQPRSTAELEALMHADWPAAGTIARGAGCAYGDAAQRAGGRVIDMLAVHGIADFDAETGEISALAGTPLATLLEHVAPRGWMLPVVPGTMRVTLGGAIAADVHGKNHHRDGSIGDHLVSLRLLTADGQVVESQPGDDVFAATVGGMGLTGIVLDARLRLLALPSSCVEVDTDRVDDVEAAIGQLYDDDGRRYCVAWVDAIGSRRGRAIVTRADHAPGPRHAGPTDVSRRSRRVPRMAGALLRRDVIRAHNELRFRAAPRRARGRVEPLARHLFPLDRFDGWNRLYGADGLVQYQFVVPTGADDIVRWVLERLRQARVPVYLAVLKRLGPAASDRPLSFPLAGLTLACDIPGSALADGARVLRALDERVADAGGRVYLAKDGRLEPSMLAAMYPQLPTFLRTREGIDPDARLRSDLAARLDLCR